MSITPLAAESAGGGRTPGRETAVALHENRLIEKSATDLVRQAVTLADCSWAGFATQYFNGGGLRTRGLELGLTFVPIHSTGVNWTARGTFSMNRCKITDLPVPAFRPISFLNGNTFGSTFIDVTCCNR